MKFNKWTLGLAALGVVSLASVAKADTAPAPNYVESATKGVSISGYVDTSVNYQATDTGSRPTPLDGIPFFTPSDHKTDGFNLDVVNLTIEKDVDASPWSSGFKVETLAGPDAVGYNSTGLSGGGGDFGIKQAYVELMAPLGNGLDIKLGTFDTVIGYEVFEAGSNPNFTRSWGWDLEPTEHTGLLLTYKFSDMVSASLGVANTLSAGINARNVYLSQDSTALSAGTSHYWWKTVMGSVTITAPSSWGFMGGSSFYLGAVNGYNAGATLDGGDGVDQLNLYAGAVLNTPLKELTTGFAFDYVGTQYFGIDHFDVYNFGVYGTYKATDKLSFNGRAEYGFYDYSSEPGLPVNPGYWEITGTAEYDLWANVMSRLEVRYDAAPEGINPGVADFNDPAFSKCGVALYLNLIYKF